MTGMLAESSQGILDPVLACRGGVRATISGLLLLWIYVLISLQVLVLVSAFRSICDVAGNVQDLAFLF